MIRGSKIFLYFIFLLFFLIFPSDTLADKSYSISSVKINLGVNKNGSMDAQEIRTYHFNGSYTFAYQYINKYGNSNDVSGRDEAYTLKNIKICDSEGCYKRIDPKLGESLNTPAARAFYARSYYTIEYQDKYYIKWFFDASDVSKTFSIYYTVDNAVTLQTDTAEIYWKLVGSDWEISQSDIEGTIRLPSEIANNDIQAWAHGPLTGKVSVPDNKTVTYWLPNLTPGNFFEARVIVPKNIFTNGVKGDLSKEKIILAENEFILQTQTKLKQERLTITVAIIVSVLILVLQIFYFIRTLKLFFRYGKDNPLPDVNISGRLWDPPSNIDPAQIEKLMSGQPGIMSANSFTASILSLVQKKNMKIVRSDKKSGLIFAGYTNSIKAKNEKDINKLSKSAFHYKTNRIHSSEGHYPTLMAGETNGRYYIYHEGKVRRLTMNECFRITGFPENYKKIGVKSALYKAIGNSIAVPMVKAIADEIKIQLFNGDSK